MHASNIVLHAKGRAASKTKISSALAYVLVGEREQ